MTDTPTTPDPIAQTYDLSSDILADLQQAVSAPIPVQTPEEQINAIKDTYLAQHERKKEQLKKPDVQAQIDQIKAGLN